MADQMVANVKGPGDEWLPDAPSLSELGDLEGIWFKVAGTIWGICVAGAVMFLAKGFLEYAAARQQGYSEKIGESAKDIKHALIGLAGLAGLPVIVGAVMGLMN
jgi:hypothetical protein